jgi:hypothetical protein
MSSRSHLQPMIAAPTGNPGKNAWHPCDRAEYLASSLRASIADRRPGP